MAAPGVDILVPAPENTYQITTGTSVAAAEVSGIVALLLERNPKLTPADIRRILQVERQAARRRRARRQFRLRPDRPAQGAAAGRSPNRGHDAHAYAYAAAALSQSRAGAHWSAWSPAGSDRWAIALRVVDLLVFSCGQALRG